MNEIKHYDDFTHVLNRMSNDDFAYILTSYAESKGKKLKLLPIFVDKFNSLSWVGYFTENGAPFDDNCKIIITEILTNAYLYDYVLVEELNDKPKLSFFTKDSVKCEMFKHPFVASFFVDKNAWNEPLYPNGFSNDIYVAFNRKYDIIVGIMYVRADENVEVDKIAFVGTDVDFDYVQKVDENLYVLEDLGQADTYIYTKTNFDKKIFVKNEKDFDFIKSLPLYKNSVELVKEFPNE